MKRKPLLSLLLFAFAATILLSNCHCGGGGNGGTGGTGTITVPTTVTFGNSGTCLGAGMCSCLVPNGNKTIPQNGGLPVSFSLDPNNPTGILMSFLLQDLVNAEPGQQQYMPPAATTYVFPVAFPLDPQLIGSLGLQPGSGIPAGSIGKLTTTNNADGTPNTVTIAVGTSPAANYVNANVVFGNPPAAITSQCDPTLGGICSVTGQPGSIPVTFTVVSQTPSMIQMSFSLTALRQQPPQYQMITTVLNGVPVTSYTFASAFYFINPANNSIFSQPQLGLQGANPNIPQGTVGKVAINGDLVTYTFPYSQN